MVQKNYFRTAETEMQKLQMYHLEQNDQAQLIGVVLQDYLLCP